VTPTRARQTDPQLPEDRPATDAAAEAPAEHVPLGVEKLEGRQESGRDAQDEAEEDEPEG
jgi:hypothetical protein